MTPTPDSLRSLRDEVVSGPQRPPPRRSAFLRRSARRLVLRLIKPYTVHQRDLDSQIVDALDTVSQRLASLEATASRVHAAHFAQQPTLDAMHGVVAAARGTSDMWELPVESFAEDVAGSVYGFRGGGGTCAPDDLYRRLEDVFRGPPEYVRDRQRRYVELIGARSPVVEVGCGRGTFLDALRDRGVEYVGVEPDPGMLEASRARGHAPLVATDANSYLETLDDDSVAVVFSTQVIEHMAADYLEGFLRLSLAKLQPGGLFIAETPNPHSPHSHKTFWMDLTHEHPIFPELALGLCWLVGYDSAYIFHPAGSGDAQADRFTEPEYALVAGKAEGRRSGPGG